LERLPLLRPRQHYGRIVGDGGIGGSGCLRTLASVACRATAAAATAASQQPTETTRVILAAARPRRGERPGDCGSHGIVGSGARRGGGKSDPPLCVEGGVLGWGKLWRGHRRIFGVGRSAGRGGVTIPLLRRQAA